jgi:heat shock protein HtpX
MPLNYTRTVLLLGALTLIFVSVGYALGGLVGMVLAFVFALAMNLFNLYKSDQMVLRMHKAQEVDASSGGQLYEIVRGLAQRAGLPMPHVAIMQNPQPNAFATGRNPKHATVAVSTGLLEILTPEEIAGVLAHELAHIKNHDTLTMTIAASIGGAISMMAQYLQFSALFGRGSGSRFGWLGFVFAALVAPLSAMLVQMAISRSREYQADRMGAEICGHPRWLASALVKIHQQAQRIRNETAEAHRSSAHLFIVNPLSGRWSDSLFASHPNIENRLAELEKLAAEMGAEPLSTEPSILDDAARKRVSRRLTNTETAATRPSNTGSTKQGPWG